MSIGLIMIDLSFFERPGAAEKIQQKVLLATRTTRRTTMLASCTRTCYQLHGACTILKYASGATRGR